MSEHEDELGVQMVPFKLMVYVQDRAEYMPVDEVPEGVEPNSISGNIRRIGYVASEITKAGGIAICAPIAPYAAIRRENKKLISALGGYILVHISTPLEVCEQRDRKGLYAKARAGIIKEFTGISDPYEAPKHPAVRIDTTDITPEEAAHQIFLHLEKEGYIGAAGP